jgi:hypothetical protein
MVRDRFAMGVCLGAGPAGEDRVRDGSVQPTPLAESHRVVDDVARDPMFIAIHAGPMRLVNQAAHCQPLQALADLHVRYDTLEQPHLELVANHRRGARQPQQLRGQALDARLDQAVKQAGDALMTGCL